MRSNLFMIYNRQSLSSWNSSSKSGPTFWRATKWGVRLKVSNAVVFADARYQKRLWIERNTTCLFRYFCCFSKIGICKTTTGTRPVNTQEIRSCILKVLVLKLRLIAEVGNTSTDSFSDNEASSYFVLRMISKILLKQKIWP